MPEILTVTGSIHPSALGVTLAHEHLYCDLSKHSGREDNHVTDIAVMTGEMQRFRAAGGRSIIEMTCEGIGRDPAKLRQLSEASGVRIVSGIAFYEHSTWPAWAQQADVDTIADFFTAQIKDGVDGIRAGVIGELFSHNEPEPNPQAYRLDEYELRLFQAAARAQRRTDVAIMTHASLGRGGHAQLNVLERAGADLSRVAIGHCDAHWHSDADRDMAYYLPILKRGAVCAFDLVGWTELMPDEVRAQRIASLVQMGYAGQILISSDTCRRTQLHANGGRGLDYVLASFLPRLRGLGVTDAHIVAMTVDAPRRLLCGDAGVRSGTESLGPANQLVSPFAPRK
jgi:predicted metal-dependent phosphotriesterase family hydrolase